MTIVGGHQRAKVLKEIGYKKLTVLLLILIKQREKALNIALNKISGEWDLEALAKLLDDLKVEDYNVELTGFDMKEAEKLWDEYIKEETEQEEEIPEAPENLLLKSGDIILLGKHRVICGDATKAEDIEKLMNGNKAKLTVTDPPYGIAYVGKTE